MPYTPDRTMRSKPADNPPRDWDAEIHRIEREAALRSRDFARVIAGPGA
jgi:hypothetical protein